jgi:hypothetical protein
MNLNNSVASVTGATGQCTDDSVTGGDAMMDTYSAAKATVPPHAVILHWPVFPNTIFVRFRLILFIGITTIKL